MDRFSDNSFSSPQNPHGQFRIFSNFSSTIFKKKNISAPYIREQENYGGILAGENGFLSLKKNFFSSCYC